MASECYKIHNFASGKKSQNIILLPKKLLVLGTTIFLFFLNQIGDICEIISPKYEYSHREAVSRET